jgi:hypothetical protein
VHTTTHLKVVVEEQEGQTTLVREVGMSIIRGWVQVTGAHHHSPEGCGGGAGGEDPLLREMGMSIIRGKSRSQVPTSTHLKGFGRGAGGADHPAEGDGDVNHQG